MFVDFFIKQSIFASVCAIIIFLIGLISIATLPIARFPEISPTQITVTSNYISAISSFLALTLTPFLCGVLLRQGQKLQRTLIIALLLLLAMVTL
ncbi:efflux RND transporter permease subunit [uncultured Nostoc sp.]|uniref:efflux RND transporter permease subunit n=1 Tax=uncultured Nostoc sp. TaxID=340711 RepID=UPI0035CA1EF0